MTKSFSSPSVTLAPKYSNVELDYLFLSEDNFQGTPETTQSTNIQ